MECDNGGCCEGDENFVAQDRNTSSIHQVVCYGQDVMAHVIVACTCTWAHAITIRVAMEVVKRMCQLTVEQAARCVLISFYLGNADADVP